MQWTVMEFLQGALKLYDSSVIAES